MRPSHVMSLRALVMILCMIVVPLAAVCRTSLPEIVRSALRGESHLFATNSNRVNQERTLPQKKVPRAAIRSVQSLSPMQATDDISQAKRDLIDTDVVPADYAESSRSDGRFGRVERRLRELGATYFRLETCGPHGELYRFQCQVAISPQSRRVRHFEATEGDCLAAPEKVLNQVEAWHSRQRR